MALYIVENNTTERIWHIGESFPYINIDNLNFIQADGDELDFITTKFGHSIPTPDNRVVRWYGDIAKTIIFSLH